MNLSGVSPGIIVLALGALAAAYFILRSRIVTLVIGVAAVLIVYFVLKALTNQTLASLAAGIVGLAFLGYTLDKK